MIMTARDYRVSARTHALRAAALLTGKGGLSPAQRDQVLKAAVSHLASAMAHASAAVALSETTAAIDIDSATTNLVSGLEALLAEQDDDDA